MRPSGSNGSIVLSADPNNSVGASVGMGLDLGVHECSAGARPLYVEVVGKW